jgi:type VI secretion system protein ImpJ
MPNKPVWSEGVLVSQHHFQQQDRYHEQLLSDRLRAVVHYDWGITELEIDAAGLASSQLRIVKFKAIWPDGASLACGEGYDQPAPPPRNFEAAFTAGVDRLEVFLGIVDEGDASPILSRPHEPQSGRRFVQAAKSVPDLNSGGSVEEVEWARPNVRLFIGNERRDGYSVVRVAELLRQATGRAIVRDNHVPPVLHLGASAFLQAGLNRVLTVATSRQKDLAAERGQRSPGNVEFHATAAQTFWLLHTLNGVIPVLSHLLETPRAHPEEAYLVLASLIGQLSSFAADADPRNVPKFNYLELGDMFEVMFARAVSLLSGQVDKPYVEIELERRADGMYLGKLRDPKLISHEIFVAVTANQVDAVVRDRAPAVLKIASWNQIYDVVKQARRGVRVDVEWNPSVALPVRPGVCFFRVRREGNFWDEVASSSTLALYLPSDGDWKDANLSVYAIEPRRLSS